MFEKNTHTVEIIILLHIQELPLLVRLPDRFSTEHSLVISLCTNIWWLVRVTLVVAFDFLPKKFGGGSGQLRMILLLLYKCSLSSVDS